MTGPNLHWHRVRLNAEDLANGKQLSLVDQFAELYQRMQSPADVDRKSVGRERVLELV